MERTRPHGSSRLAGRRSPKIPIAHTEWGIIKSNLGSDKRVVDYSIESWKLDPDVAVIALGGVSLP